jgi:hypothetical protein
MRVDMNWTRMFLIAGMVWAAGGAGAIAGDEPVDAAQGKVEGGGKNPEEQLHKAQKVFGWGGIESILKGDWEGIQKSLVKFFAVIFVAIALGAVLAYHPYAGRRTSLEDLEQPKIIITYTVVGALIAIIVAPIPAMAFAIFGIGGLMRFRTELGAAKETGRTILATILGLACGLEFWLVAVFGTAIAWVLIYVLESRIGLRMAVRGVRSENIAATAETYGQILRSLRCRFSPPRKNPGKGQVTFVISVPRGVEREDIETTCNEKVPKEVRGTIDWPED